jgi:peptidoglycan-associated lipoprotein
LGKRRGESVKDYLIELGIKPARIETVSFGEEKPAVLGKNDEAWTKNRRVEFVIK